MQKISYSNLFLHLNMNLKSLYNPEVYAECLGRLAKITAESAPQWGKMSAAQMFAHCTEVQLVTNGEKDLKSPLLMKLFKSRIRKTAFGDVPYAKNSPTAAQYVIKDEKDFQQEKKHLLTALATFHNMEPAVAEHIAHPFFGKIPLDERGWGMYKHLNHHLVQFGV